MSSRTNGLRIARIAALGTLAAFAACYFGEALGVADLEERRIVGMLTANNDADGERDRIYVGQHWLGTPWNPVEAKVVAIDAATGAQTGETILWPEAPEIRAVAADPDDEYVWTLHDEGSVVVWEKDLGNPLAMGVGFFEPPNGLTSAVFCDLEILPEGQLLGTGVAFDGESTVGYVHHKAPDPTSTGGYYPGWLQWEVQVLPGEENELTRYCPRIAYDDATAEIILLERSVAVAFGFDVVERFEGLALGPYAWTLTSTGGFSTPPRPKMRPIDITAAYNHVFLLREYFIFGFGTPGAEVDIHHTDTGVHEDRKRLEEIRAVHWADFILDPDNPTALWWAGHDLDSEKELGTIETINDEPIGF